MFFQPIDYAKLLL
jgi:beta-amyrin synthase